MARILALDLETTGVETASCHVTEIGAALYDPERRAVLATFASLCRLPVGCPFPEHVQKLTGILPTDLEEFGVPLPNVLLSLGRLCVEHQVERLLGHNGRSFDAEVLRAEIARFVAPPPEILLLTKLPWLDTLEDLPLPDETTSRRLGHLAADHGLPPSPWAHRALLDALQSLRLMECYPLDEVLRRADSPVSIVQAVVTFQENQKAKSLGFQWDAPERRWIKRVKELDADRLRQRAKEIGLELRKVA